MERSENNFQVSVTVIMVQFIRLRGDFWAGFISDHRTASQLLSQREAARMVPIFAQPIILAYGTCLSKNFQPFGRRVAKRALRQKSNQRRLLRLTPL
jgi:hypothetical protein